MPDWSEQERWLRNRRSMLVAELNKIEDRLDDELPKDWEDRSSERQGDEVLESLGNHDLSELHQIDAALERLGKNTFGRCTKCGEPIGQERLKALPATPFCRRCAMWDLTT